MPTNSLILVDNFDSFTYNLVQAFQALDQVVTVLRNSELTLPEIVKLKPQSLVIGPGPGSPRDAGISKELLMHFAGDIPILGVCLGHQCLGEIYGGRTVRALRPMHGMLSEIHHNGEGLFHGLSNPLRIVRYHSLIVEKSTLPHCLEITAETPQGEIMALRHCRFHNLQSVQFHPESVLTEEGMLLLRNFTTS